MGAIAAVVVLAIPVGLYKLTHMWGGLTPEQLVGSIQENGDSIYTYSAGYICRNLPNTAKLLLTKTDLAADDILEILATIPTHRESAFEQAMAAIKNPDIRPAAEADNETPEAVAQRIASLI